MRSLSLITGVSVVILSFLGVLYLALSQVKEPENAGNSLPDVRPVSAPVEADEEEAKGNEGEAKGQSDSPAKSAIATFGSGCFWCTEAVFERLKGVTSVKSGYCGGTVKNPTYKQVCLGTTGHAEVVQVKYNPEVISFSELLKVFWSTHDPTTLNRQGNDFGTQYRSVIFYHDEDQREQAASIKKKLNDAKEFGRPIVTEISPYKVFYIAEVDHQDYYRLNKRQPYCYLTIRPKMQKLDKYFKEKLKAKVEDDQD
ncbi:MAG TPA: peptide-methionine (S)-S-oxide reductase [Planctomycetaceae bacterium]|nr:peptide-methionine (S)-S-oxide reductase [Blastopirellula sp.]HAY81143.1 peptide-methionine (S)-S-oxide reductase [Planctomycetaceae bacterium]